MYIIIMAKTNEKLKTNKTKKSLSTWEIIKEKKKIYIYKFIDRLYMRVMVFHGKTQYQDSSKYFSQLQSINTTFQSTEESQSHNFGMT